MRIIIDGNDGIGKTTFIKELQQKLDITSYIHLSNKDPRDFNFYKTILKKEDVIFDRSFIDERIYSEVFGREPMLTKEEEQELHFITKLDSKTVVIICHNEIKRHNKDEHNLVIKYEKHIDNRFREIADKYNYLYLDLNNKNEKKEIIQYLKELQRSE